ncbi:MAG: hypothetical protein ACI33M_14095 [Lysinibacillus sp.]
MKYVIGFLFMALVLGGAPFLSNQEVPSVVFLFIGLILVMTIAILVFIHTKFADEHRTLLTIGVCFFITVVFAPCLAVFNLYSESITDWMFIRYLAVFILAPIIWGSSVILSYRYYFIAKN